MLIPCAVTLRDDTSRQVVYDAADKRDAIRQAFLEFGAHAVSVCPRMPVHGEMVLTGLLQIKAAVQFAGGRW